MSQDHDERERLLNALTQLCNGELDEAESLWLADRIEHDSVVRRIYIEYLDLHSALAWEASSAAELDGLVADVLPNPGPIQAESEPSRWRRIGNWFVGTRLRTALTVASSFLIVMLTVLAISPAPLFVFDRQNPTENPVDRVVAGRITGSVDCVWQETALPLGFGSSLYKGQQIELLSGTAEVTFASGAVVTLRGPATYVLDSDARSTLRTGELVAVVPQRAVGFTVQTPAAVVVDRGTRFGIVVESHGEDDVDSPVATVEEIHVFDGAVDLSLRGSNAPPRRLTDRQAVRIDEIGEVKSLPSSQRDIFPTEIKDEGDTTTADPLPASEHPPVTEHLVLWLAADGALRKDARGRVTVWEDMLAGDNTKAQNATGHSAQNRPLLVQNSIGGKPALRFDGDDTLTLATPSSLDILNSSYEVFVVARSASPTIQFLIGGGVEDFELHLNGDAGVRFIPAGYNAGTGASDLEPNGTFTRGRAHVYSARVKADNYHGIVAVDGRESADVAAVDCRSSNNTSLRLGMRHDASFALQGEIAEVLVYSNALTAGERDLLLHHLSSKYSITTK